jgi:hypothetical protein
MPLDPKGKGSQMDKVNVTVVNNGSEFFIYAPEKKGYLIYESTCLIHSNALCAFGESYCCEEDAVEYISCHDLN